eukprot:6184009-Pleurochrysis_carterae.AAC.5
MELAPVSGGACTLSCERLHTRPRSVAGADGGGEYVFDPRFLIFEFTHNMLLREAQVRSLTRI